MTSVFVDDAELEWFREQAEAGMIDKCKITRDGEGEPVFDPETGKYVDPPRVVVYEGKCRFQAASIANAASAVVTAGERYVNVQGGELQLPVRDTGGVAVGDIAEIIESPEDVGRVGREYTIQTRFEKTHATSRRLRLAEAVG